MVQEKVLSGQSDNPCGESAEIERALFDLLEQVFCCSFEVLSKSDDREQANVGLPCLNQLESCHRESALLTHLFRTEAQLFSESLYLLPKFLSAVLGRDRQAMFGAGRNWLLALLIADWGYSGVGKTGERGTA